MEYCKLGKMQYVIKYPKSFTEDKRFPAILVLHGAGGRGNDIFTLTTNPYFVETSRHKDFPFVSFAPLCSEHTWFDMWELLKALVKKIASLPFVDEKRIYMFGVSMGGYAAWQLAMSIPEYFAAIAPICGGGMYWNAFRLANVPVWAFHGALDNVVLPEESQKMVDRINASGGNAKLTIYPENYHNAWNDTYSNYEVFEWFLKHTNKNDIELIDKYNSSDIYG